MLNENKLNRIFAGVVFLISTIVYLTTVAPTTSFWDCGEFIACSYTLGVPHPPGAPLYILIGRLFSMIPFVKDIGLRVNAISSITSGLTIMMLYLTIIRLVIIFRGSPKTTTEKFTLYASGIIGSLLFAFTDTQWFNAVEAEVYAISQFITAMVVWLILVWHDNADDPHSDRYLLLIAYLVGMAIGVHLLMILALPAIALVIYFKRVEISMKTMLWALVIFVLSFVAIYPGTVKWIPNLAHDFSGWVFVIVILAVFSLIYYAVKNNRRYMTIATISFFLVILGMSLYTAIYIRSNLNPDIDENDPETIEQMTSYLNRDQYGDWGYIDRRAPLWEYQIKKMYLRYFGWQFIGQGDTLGPDRRIVENFSLRGFYGLPFLFGLIGLFYHFRKDWKHASFISVLFLMTGLAIVIYLNQDDPQPRERDYVYTGSFYAFAIWIGIGLYFVLDKIRKKTSSVKILQTPLLAIVSLLLFVALPVNVLAFNYHSHDRSGNYIAYDYSYNILQSCEENSILFTNGDNDTFPLWFLQYVYGIRTDVRVVNLSLLNTSWYIKQLKNQEPRVPINMKDSAIDDIGPRLWPKEGQQINIPVPRDTYIHDMSEATEHTDLMDDSTKPPEISVNVKPTLYGQALRVQDIMVLNIIYANQFRRPVTFALTVSRDNMLNLHKYLRMDGLVFKLVTYPDERISPSKLYTNLMTKFQYRNLNNPNVYYNENIKGLLRNYHGAFFSLAQYYAQEKEYDKMTAVLDTLNSIMPQNVIPMRADLNYQMGLMYYQAGQKDKFRQRLDQTLEVGIDDNQELLQYANVYSSLFKDYDKAESIAKGIIEKQPDFMDAYYWLLSFYNQEKKYDKGVELLTKWMQDHPDDNVARTQLEQFQRYLKSKSKKDSTESKTDTSMNTKK
ncbi:DUF2723 domain-containing protein [candidate division KSB1 bacterium]|nr:DUF2723 domain-containing protein [candidate division KSB1 bacterium]